MTDTVIPAPRLPLAGGARLTSPPGRFITGHLAPFAQDPLGFVTSCARDHGDLVPLTFLGKRACLLAHPDFIEHILATHYRDFHKIAALSSPFMKRLMGTGLVASEDEFWVRQRRLAQPAFHRERIRSYAVGMVGLTRRMLDRWQVGDVRDAHEEMMQLTLEIAARTLFDVDVSGEAARVGELLQTLLQEFTGQWSVMALVERFVPTPSSIRSARVCRELDAIIYGIIARRRASGRDTGDLLSMLLQARDDDGTAMTDAQLRDETMTFFFAGHETTAITMSWAWYLLSQHPEIERRLLAELKDVLDGREPGFDDLPRLQYAEWVIKETMRLYPPVWSMGRTPLRDFELAGHRIAAGTQLVISQWVTHRDSRFFDRPDEFDPDRWAPERADRIPRYAYFPFGAGPRGCIGLSFAMMEAVLILAAVAQRFRLALAPGAEVAPWATMTLRPKDGVRVTLESRENGPDYCRHPVTAMW